MNYHLDMTIPAWLPVTISSSSVVLALLAFIWQIHRARFNQSVDLLLRLEADFFGSVKKAQRAKAAEDLLAGKSLEAEPILDFFETIAMLLRRGALDKEMVWHTFFHWIDHYYAAACEHIERRQVSEPLVWKDLEAFVGKLRQIQAAQTAVKRYTPPAPDQIAEFLAEELTETT